ncbi:SGNH/GDSL hydrolase family protein [Stieleria maiorica]|uniref:SGNH/GDSL hydrolase family protein n=1 Tax=Stieleria maiorica TaxID=2795974 RepID=UPI00142F2BD3|nr:SGNH/GDSL hydrolase family protein [Stieleria maiorica]
MAARPLATILVLALSVGVTAPQCVQAGVVVFGDSLSDTGNVFAASGGAAFAHAPGSRFPSPPFASGVASNGVLWVDVLASRLGETPPGPALIGGTNYAFIGAMTGTQVSSPFGVPSMSEQVGLYLSSNAGVAPPDDIFALWGGANDFFFGQFDPGLAVSNLSDQIQLLAGAGAREFLVANLIPLSLTPSLAGTPTAASATAFSHAFNTTLATEIGTLRTDLDVTIHELDVAGLFEEVSSDPAAFGFTNTVDPALHVELSTSIPIFPYDVVGNPDEYLWWDGVHPTAAVQSLIGERAAALVRPVPEPASAAIWIPVALIYIILVRRRLFVLRV